MPVSGSVIGNEQSLRQEKFCVMLNVRKDITHNEILRIRSKIAKILRVKLSALIIDGRIDQPQTSEGQP